MSYIEREALEKWLLTESASLDSEEDCKYVVERLREEIPAADVREVRRAEWVELWNDRDQTTSSEARCSKCGRISARPVGDFCKWCGADMRKKETGK